MSILLLITLHVILGLIGLFVYAYVIEEVRIGDMFLAIICGYFAFFASILLFLCSSKCSKIIYKKDNK